MLKYIRWIVPRRIASQIGALVVGSVLLHLILLLIVATFYYNTVEDNPIIMNQPMVVKAMLITKMIAATPDPQERANLFKAVIESSPGFRLENYVEAMSLIPPEPNEVNNETGWTNIQAPTLQSELKIKVSVGAMTENNGYDKVMIALEDGFAMSFPLPTELQSDIPAAFQLLAVLGSFAIVLMMISVWAANKLGSPLSRLAKAAGHFDADQPFEEIPEKGPTEVIKVSRAFNEMGKRTSQLVEDRTYLIAAVSHDLRTPLTRLRLRTEDVADPELKKQMLGDLGTMDRMVQSALTYVRSMKQCPDHKSTDLTSLLQSICDEFADLQQPVNFTPHARFPIKCDQDQIARAVNNIIQNALKVDAEVNVSLSEAEQGMVDIAIEDNGPGIPDSQKQTMLKPFQRGDQARTVSDHDGFGLGLSICAAIATAHGGKIILQDAKPHGLIVRMRLPLDEKYYQPPPSAL
jgi:signal transduction histidine kinase